MLRALIYLLPLALAIYSFIDCLNTPENEVRHLPKIAWVFIILMFLVAGPAVWFLAGKKRVAPGGGWVAPDDNPDFLKSLGNGAKKDEPGGDGPARGESGRDESGRGEPGNGEPARDEPGNGEPARDEPGRGEPGRDESGSDEPSSDESGKDKRPE